MLREQAEGPTKRLEAEIAAIQQQIANVGGKRLESQKKALDKATAKLDESSSTATKCKVQLSSAAKNKTKAEKAAAKYVPVTASRLRCVPIVQPSCSGIQPFPVILRALGRV